MRRIGRSSLAFLAGSFVAQAASAVSSAELYKVEAYRYGRFDARIRYAAGEGVVSSFFLWKDGSEVSGTYWNELDFEKLNGDCRMQTNTLYGTPVTSGEQIHRMPADMCEAYHDYRFEWTPTYIAWFIDGTEIRRETGAVAAAFADNASAGMQMRFNVWPGNANFGGNFDPAILPVRQYISWVAYSSYQNGSFRPEWREEFDGPGVPSGWATGNWASPLNLSTHNTQNVTFVNGIAVLSLTSDQAPGFTGTPPADGGGGAPSSGGAGPGGTSAGGMSAGGASSAGMSAGGANAGSMNAGGISAGGMSAGGATMSAGAGGAVAGTGAVAGATPAAGASGANTNQGGSAGSSVATSAGTGGVTSGVAGNVSAGAHSAGSTGAGERSDEGGCGCRVTSSSRRGVGGVSAALLALVALRRRRRAR